MIVNYKANGWEVITQRSHALLALQLALHWQAAEQGQRWPELLVAIADHDDAQIELQRNDLLTPQGGPLDLQAIGSEDSDDCGLAGTLSKRWIWPPWHSGQVKGVSSGPSNTPLRKASSSSAIAISIFICAFNPTSTGGAAFASFSSSRGSNAPISRAAS